MLKLLYQWLEDEDEIPGSPMAKMRPPIVPDQPVPVIPDDGLRRLLAACADKGFEARRDTAMIMLLLDTGARRAELIDLKLAHVDLDLDVLLVLGKGRRERALPYGHKAGAALDRYLRARARHKDIALPWLWLGLQGRLTRWGLVQMLRRRGEQAGLPGLHPHQLRHTFAHQWLAEGGGETDLMRLAGWKSRAMLQRYGASAADAPSPRRAPTPLPRRPPVARFGCEDQPHRCGQSYGQARGRQQQPDFDTSGSSTRVAWAAASRGCVTASVGLGPERIGAYLVLRVTAGGWCRVGPSCSNAKAHVSQAAGLSCL